MSERMSESKERELSEAIERRLDYWRSNKGNINEYAMLLGFIEAALPGILSDKQADELIEALAAGTTNLDRAKAR